MYRALQTDTSRDIEPTYVMKEKNMRVTATLGLLVIMAFSAPAFSQSFLGDWTATADTPNGKVSETLNVKKTMPAFQLLQGL